MGDYNIGCLFIKWLEDFDHPSSVDMSFFPIRVAQDCPLEPRDRTIRAVLSDHCVVGGFGGRDAGKKRAIEFPELKRCEWRIEMAGTPVC